MDVVAESAADPAAAPGHADTPEPADRATWIALIVLCVGVLMIVLDVTIVNVAMPSIQQDLGFSQSSLAWVINAYVIAFGGFLLLAGRLGDLISRKGIFLAGLAVFVVSSIACGAAQTQEMLVTARFVQGIGGAMTSAVILGMIVTMFPDPREQARAFGYFAFVASAGGAIGLLLGGVLTESINWHWIFFVNVPIGAATAVLANRLLPADRGIGWSQGADVPGAVLVTSSLMLGVFTIVSPAAESGWGATRTIVLGVTSLVLLALFVARQATAAHPLMPLRIFRSRNVIGTNLIQVFSAAGMFGMFFLGALYLQRVLQYDPLETGLAFLPGTVLMGVLSFRYAERLVMRFGGRPLVMIGLAMIAAGLAWFARAPVDGEYVVHVLPVMLAFGIGGGIAFPALINVAMSGVPHQDAGLVSGLVNTTAQVGGALGLAVLATLSATRSERLVGDGVALSEALTRGYHVSLLVSAALVIVALAIAAFVLETPPESGHETPS